MRVALFNAKPYERELFQRANARHGHELDFLEPRLTARTAGMAEGQEAVSVFVNDQLDARVLSILARGGTRHIALRSAGYNHVDLAAARELGLSVVRVPAYSPHAIAEHAVGLMLTLNRRLCRANQRVREGNFALDGLMGFDLAGRVAGVVGTGAIGRVVTRILRGFSMRVLAHDLHPHPECMDLGVEYVDLETLFGTSDVISLHCPLTPETQHLIDASALARMRDGVMLINTSRGGLIDTRAVIAALKTGKLGHLGLDVYEEEGDLFFQDRSDDIIQDDVFTRLLTFPNVLTTAHQAFFTREAVGAIVETTLANLSQLERGEECPHRVSLREEQP